MDMALDTIEIATEGQGLYEFTAQVNSFVEQSEFAQGLLNAYCRHTSCSLVIQENADPDVRRDMKEFFVRLVPEGMDWVKHTCEGPDDMPAHIKSALTATSLSVPVDKGQAMFGIWQGIYLFEHRLAPHPRQVVLQIIGR